MNLRALEKRNIQYATLVDPGNRYTIESFKRVEIEYVTRMGHFSWKEMWKDTAIGTHALAGLEGKEVEVVCLLDSTKIGIYEEPTTLIRIGKKYAVVGKTALKL